MVLQKSNLEQLTFGAIEVQTSHNVANNLWLPEQSLKN